MKKQGALDISFAWLFAIIIGGFILFLAVYAAIRLIGTEQTVQDAKTGKEIGVLLDPLETGFESGKTNSLTLPVETRIYNKCNNQGNFGRQIIQISQKSFNKWTETNINVGFSNKYLFSENYTEGKKFYLFSKPFEFPFKVADLIYITSSADRYCFVNPPEQIDEELKSLKQENILSGNCSSGIKICFSGENGCEINVNYNAKYVEKNKEQVYFEGDSLMYAAIFSDKDIYECQLKRLMQRIEQLTLLYRDKANFVSTAGCNSNLNSDLMQLNTLAKNLKSSGEIYNLKSLTEDISYKNEIAKCRIW
jgi:hypothetical protein